MGSGNWDDGGNWSGGAMPTVNDMVTFQGGAGFPFPYTVTFPNPNDVGFTEGYASSNLLVRDNGVTFSGSTLNSHGPSTYTVASTTQTEANRGIIIGEDAGENASLSVIGPAMFQTCCGGLRSFSGVAATIGDSAGATGALNMNFGAFDITGSNDNQTQLIIGNNGTGTLNVANGADVNVTGFNSATSLGHHSMGVGSVNINGAGSTWTSNNKFWVGENGSGTLTIQNGGSLITDGTNGLGGTASSIIGTFAGSTGMVTVTGAGSTWNNSNELTVGNSGNGTLVIANGGSLINTAGFATFGIGGGFNSSGQATVTGPGSILNTNGRVYIGASAGPGTLSIDPGGTVGVAQSVNLGTNGLLQLQGGTLTTPEIGLNGLQFPGQFQWTSGTLHVGIFRKSLTNQGGTLAPGNSAGRTTIDGNYAQQAAGAMEIQLGGTTAETQYDVVDISGFATLNGQLQLSLINSFVPTALQTFTVLFSSGITGAFSNVANGQRIGVPDGSGSFLVNYGAGSAFDATQVTLSGFQAVALPGDYNHNGVVDAADYTVWRDTLGHTGSGLAADGNINGMIDAGDYSVWKSHFGTHAGSGAGGSTSAAVPEPATIALAMIAAALLWARPRAANKCSC
jgi:T5SS/PEP-CTERM-associated repeat protein